MITGKFEFARVNDYGFPSVKLSGKWIGGDKKGKAPEFAVGDLISLDVYKNPKGYDTYKGLPTLVTAVADVKTEGPAVGTPAKGGSSWAAKEGYWEAKAAADAAKEPRIVYMAALERGLVFVDLAIRSGTFGALEKAKAADKLEILEAFVQETTQRFIDESYVSATTDEMQKPQADDTAATPASEPDDSKWA